MLTSRTREVQCKSIAAGAKCQEPSCTLSLRVLLFLSANIHPRWLLNRHRVTLPIAQFYSQNAIKFSILARASLSLSPPLSIYCEDAPVYTLARVLGRDEIGRKSTRSLPRGKRREDWRVVMHIEKFHASQVTLTLSRIVQWDFASKRNSLYSPRSSTDKVLRHRVSSFAGLTIDTMACP